MDNFNQQVPQRFNDTPLFFKFNHVPQIPQGGYNFESEAQGSLQGRKVAGYKRNRQAAQLVQNDSKRQKLSPQEESIIDISLLIQNLVGEENNNNLNDAVVDAFRNASHETPDPNLPSAERLDFHLEHLGYTLDGSKVVRRYAKKGESVFARQLAVMFGKICVDEEKQ